MQAENALITTGAEADRSPQPEGTRRAGSQPMGMFKKLFHRKKASGPGEEVPSNSQNSNANVQPPLPAYGQQQQARSAAPGYELGGGLGPYHAPQQLSPSNKPAVALGQQQGQQQGVCGVCVCEDGGGGGGGGGDDRGRELKCVSLWGCVGVGVC